ncbi:glycosyltransferase family 2 protein [Marimonas lutisalis]|uniref:glycosyltransferase family 2 protein n=1 Tax=Marimonas lutisalis TaxID=2545756 RepID=UPI0010F646AB|nr:glycosyltransferase [Marimonas lutisalis]
MNALPVSVVIVSRDRPESLTWCLTGVAGLRYPNFEVIVVADPSGCDAVREAGFAPRVKLIEYDRPNIAAARNLGLAQAAGEVVAFIDDDAVPEPMWLHHLTAPFDNDDVAAAGGFVRGRNGISFQWKARMVDSCGRAEPLRVDEARPTVLHPAPGQAIKTEGTNMAVRRSALLRLGGFDPRYHFYLDETDLNLRLATGGYATAIVPLAQVHHAYAASPRRKANRAVQSLREIGASWAVFLHTHCSAAQRVQRWQEVQNEERERLDDQVVRGLLREAQAGELLVGLLEGYSEGETRTAGSVAIAQAGDAFRRFDGAAGPAVVLAGRIWQARALRRKARARVKKGETVSLFLFGPSTRFHKVCLTRDGVWEQNGGLFGRSERNQNVFQMVGFRARVAREVAQVAPVRGLDGEA